MTTTKAPTKTQTNALAVHCPTCFAAPRVECTARSTHRQRLIAAFRMSHTGSADSGWRE